MTGDTHAFPRLQRQKAGAGSHVEDVVPGSKLCASEDAVAHTAEAAGQATHLRLAQAALPAAKEPVRPAIELPAIRPVLHRDSIEMPGPPS